MCYLLKGMATKKANTKQDLENKIAELEAKLNKLATQLEAKPTVAPKPAEVKPAQVKPAGHSKEVLDDFFKIKLKNN